MRNRLGCGLNEAFVTWRCGTPRLCSITGATSIIWGRELDDISEAEVIVQLGADTDEDCCECLGDLEPWCHELHITRDGSVVWLGPITQVVYGFEQVTIRAMDVLAWGLVRVADDDINYREAGEGGLGPANLTDIALDVLGEAFGEDDPCILEYIQATPSNLDPTYRFFPALTATAFEQLDSIAATGLDYSAVGRTIFLGPEQVPAAAIGTLTDDMILDDVTMTKDGMLQANRWWVHYQDDEGFAAIGEAPQYCYGLLERVRAADDGLQTVDDANTTADIYAAAAGNTPRILEVTEGAKLSPQTPWSINDMIPGVRVDVALTRLCVDIQQSFRLSAMQVRQTVEGEEIGITLSPLNIASGEL
jgi:hypothetical protein